MKRVLLVEPNYKTQHPPMALMKLSSYHKALGDEVIYQKGFNYFLDLKPDIIYITSLFTWYYKQVVEIVLQYKNKYKNADIRVGGICASLLKDDIYKETGIEPHYGIDNSFDSQPLDYTLFPTIDYSIGYTTKSCPRKCEWCVVHRLEKKFIEYPAKIWFKQMNNKNPYKHIMLWDNNFTASSMEHQIETINTLKKLNKTVDFNQAIDCRLINEEKAKLYSQIKLKPFRFAFDDIKYDGYPQKAFKLAEKYGLNDGSCLMLYNFEDNPKNMWYRMFEIIKLQKVDIYPMRYQEILDKEMSKTKNCFISKHWGEQALSNFRMLIQIFFHNSVIGRGVTLSKFYNVFKKSEIEFDEFIRLPTQKFIEAISKNKNRTVKIEKLNKQREKTLKSYDLNTITKKEELNISEEEINNFITQNNGMISREQAIKHLIKLKSK